MSTDDITLSHDDAERLLRLARGWKDNIAIHALEKALLISPLESRLTELDQIAHRQFVSADTGKALLQASNTLLHLYALTIDAESLSVPLIRKTLLQDLS